MPASRRTADPARVGHVGKPAVHRSRRRARPNVTFRRKRIEATVVRHQTLAYRNLPFTSLLRYPPGDSALINSS